MQKFFTDKPKQFECNISVDGASINETKVRLILEFPNNRNLLFHGNIDGNGKCEITIPPLKEMKECEGNVLLEVIADSTHFESWRDTFKLETNRKVQVEMIVPKKELVIENIAPRIEIINNEEPEVIKENSIVFKKFKNYINENNINFGGAIKNKSMFLNLLVEYRRNTNSSKEDVLNIFEEIKELIKNNQISRIL